MAKDGEVLQRRHFCRHGTKDVTERLQVDETIMRCFQAELFAKTPTNIQS